MKHKGSPARAVRLLCSRRIRRTAGLTFLCTAFFITYTVISELFQPDYVYVNNEADSECVIPKLDPFDPDMMKYYYKLPPLNCDTNPDLVVVDDRGMLLFNEQVVKNNLDSISCTYSIVERIDDYKVKFHPVIKFVPPADIPADFFFVSCYDAKNQKTIYEKVLTKIFSKNVTEFKKPKPVGGENLSVVIFGIDSMSQLHAHRSIPKSLKYLRDELEGYIFKGFNKVGGSTFGNMLPLFSGHLHETKGVDYLKIFKNFSRKGHVTFLAEDLPYITPRQFKEPPTDHFLRPFYFAAKSKRPVHLSLDATFYMNHVFKYIEHKSSFNIGKSSSLCYGNKPNHMILVDYYKQFLQAYKDKLVFTYSWLTELGHDYINMVGHADEDVLKFMKWMKDEKFFENTVFLLMSDHGQRINGKIRNTPMGRIEDRMPFVSMVIPKRLKEKYPHLHTNLQANTEKLTSPFDLHETLLDIVGNRFGYEEPTGYTAPSTEPRGISLFRKIPKGRSCIQAKVPEHFCACYGFKPISPNDRKVDHIANVIVDFINNKLKKEEGKCEVLSVKRVDNAEVVKSALERKSNLERFDRIERTINFINNFLPGYNSAAHNLNSMYRLTIETTPGEALFEATVKYIEANRRFEVVDRISRTNKYGNQSLCVKHRPFLKTMCYCKQ